MNNRTAILLAAVVLMGLIVVVRYAGGSGSDREELAATLSDPSADPAHRRQAAQSLVRYADPQTIDLLAEYATDRNADVASQSLLALGRIGNGRAAGVIRRAMNDPRQTVREAAATAMGRLPAQAADISALTSMVAADQSPQVRAAAAKSLGQLDAIQTVPRLVNALRDPDVRVRRRAISAIERILGVQFGYRADAEPAQREQAIARIETYWRSR